MARGITPVEIMNSAKVDVDGLEDLSEKDFQFVLGILQGKSAIQAYEDSRPHLKSKKSTRYGNAWKLHHKPYIQAWLSAAKQSRAGSAILTRENHLLELERLRELSIDAGDMKSAVKSEEVRGYVAGLRVERVDINVNNPAAILQEIRQMNPEVATMLAKQYAIPLDTAAPVIEHDAAEVEG